MRLLWLLASGLWLGCSVFKGPTPVESGQTYVRVALPVIGGRQGDAGTALEPLLAGPQTIAPGSFGAASRPMAVSHWRPGTLLCVAIAV